jgi:AcrR family transcriptional regulator
VARRSPTLDLEAALAGAFAPLGADQPDHAAVLDATSALLARHGLRNWSVDDVADEAGLGRATLYRHFGSRDALVQAAVTRDARRFFSDIAASVGARCDLSNLEEVVVEGLLAGLRLARSAPLGDLIRRDPAAAVALLSSEWLLATATTALVDLYQAMAGLPGSGAGGDRAEVMAEALVRLGLSFVLVPGPTADLDDEAARHRLRAIVGPLVRGAIPINGTPAARLGASGETL